MYKRLNFIMKFSRFSIALVTSFHINPKKVVFLQSVLFFTT